MKKMKGIPLPIPDPTLASLAPPAAVWLPEILLSYVRKVAIHPWRAGLVHLAGIRPCLLPGPPCGAEGMVCAR